jgi:uncharacterized protein (DUF433 family)
MSSVTLTHIRLDENGVAWIDDTKIKVIEVVTDKLAYDSSPEEMHSQYPHLSMAQIHAALTYYYDHQVELDAEIERRWREANEIAEKASNPALREKLLSLKNKKVYRKLDESDTWHWCKNCSFWPTTSFEERVMSSPPENSEVCNECRSKETASSCH